MYAKRVTEAVELAKARAGAIMMKAPAETAPLPRTDETARRELAAAEAGEPTRRGE
jgi:hypothetical protein